MQSINGVFQITPFGTTLGGIGGVLVAVITTPLDALGRDPSGDGDNPFSVCALVTSINMPPIGVLDKYS
jgi:hypothetical protein